LTYRPGEGIRETQEHLRNALLGQGHPFCVSSTRQSRSLTRLPARTFARFT
jgi:hypothetical protein